MKELDWANLPFGYMKTDYNVRIYYRNEQWGELEVCSEETIPMHMAATCLHYGQEAFEGLKAFRGKDGKVRIFRLEENAARLQSTCRGILMPELSTERFKEAILKVVKLNERFIPPYESGASLYIRPLLVGTGAQVGVHPASEYLFVVFVTPVGPYFKGGFSTNPYVITRFLESQQLFFGNRTALHLHAHILCQLHQALVRDGGQDGSGLRSDIRIVLDAEEVGSTTFVHVFLFLGIQIELTGITQIVRFLVGTQAGCIVTTYFINTGTQWGSTVEFADNDIRIG
jgi:hypothetical protein